jgi:GR25 family glycosyltransferase involved in LPS biosynthesis
VYFCQESRTAGAYIISKQGAKKMLEHIIPFVFPIDFEMNYIFEKADMNVYYMEPPIIFEGSSRDNGGQYKSSI